MITWTVFYPTNILQHTCRHFLPVNFKIMITWSVFYPTNILKHTCRDFLPVNFKIMITWTVFTPEPLRAVGVLFSPMVSGWTCGRVAGKGLSRLYLRNRKV